MITVFDAMKRPGYLIARFFCFIFIKPFIRVTILPQPLAVDVSKPCILVLPNIHASDELAVKSCAKQLEIAQYDILFLPKAGKDRANRLFVEAVDAAIEAAPETQIIPISVYWGRAPRKVGNLSQAYLADGWEVPGFIRRSLMVLFQMRQVSCYFGQAIDIEEFQAIPDDAEPQLQQAFFQGRQQLLSEQFRKQREAVIGPDLSHRRILEQQVLQSRRVVDCIDQLAADGNKSTKSLQNTARKYLHEMAADYSYSVVRLLDRFLGWVWERLYQGVNVNGMENVLAVAKDKQLIYVPCHRSHIDYLLLSYVIHQKGLMPPHIAAGINLNMPVVGSLLRRGGAFFIRREFRDNKLYRAVWKVISQRCASRAFLSNILLKVGAAGPACNCLTKRECWQ